MSLSRITWWAALSTPLAGAALAGDGGPLVMPNDGAVGLSVLPAPDPARAETAPEIVVPETEEQPLGPAGTGVAGVQVDPAPAPALPQAIDPRRSELARVGMALGAVVGLMFVLRLVMRRAAGPMAGGGRPSGVMEILGRYPIARAQQLVLLKLAGRVVLLHQSKAGMSTLSEVSDPDEVASLLARVEAAKRGGSARFPGLLSGLTSRSAARDETPFPPAAGRQVETKVVVDLTRRGRRALPRGSGAT